MRFTRRAGAVQVKLDRVEAGVLSSIVGDLLELLAEADSDLNPHPGPGPDLGSDVGPAAGPEQDPLAAMVGLPTGPVERPSDPALARLLPDAYGDDDQAAADFRRYTEADLRAGKRANAAVVLTTLAPYLDKGGKLALDREQADAWLGCLNDLRLVLGTRLEVTEETELDLRRDDPRAQALTVYGWLGWLQESLLEAMTSG